MRFDDPNCPVELLTPSQMAEADRLTIEGGTPGIELMERAGAAVAFEAADMAPDYGRIVVLCGPGNNGGDGYVAGRLLAQSGYRVRVAAPDSGMPLKGDAAVAAGRWEGAVEPFGALVLADADLIIEALFGTGLSRALEGDAAEIVEAANRADAPVLSVDLQSGQGTDGAVIEAARVVTFFRLKPAHLVVSGNGRRGDVRLHQIGIRDSVLETIKPQTFRNAPALWRDALPCPREAGHKYARGHAVVVSGGAASTGAARLGARAALRIGAGLVTVACPPSAALVNASHLTAVMLQSFGDAQALTAILSDKRKNALLIGPGAGVGEATCANVLAALSSAAAGVLDADALTSFAGAPDRLFAALAKRASDTVLTPHDGEFARIFPQISGTRLSRALTAAKESNSVVILKGADTVVAAPDGRAAINHNAPPTLATAGSGDVLAGFVTGLLAQAMPAFEGACAAVWLHGECANRFGPGLIAEDLPEMLPGVLRDLFFVARS